MECWVGLGWLVGINVRHRELNPDTVAHLSTNRVRRRLTSLIETNALTTRPDHQTRQCDRSTCADYAIPGTPALPSDSNRCHFIYRSSSALHGTFNSPRHPSNYPDNTTCVYDFIAADNEQVRITFEHFKVENYNKEWVYLVLEDSRHRHHRYHHRHHRHHNHKHSGGTKGPSEGDLLFLSSAFPSPLLYRFLFPTPLPIPHLFLFPYPPTTYPVLLLPCFLYFPNPPCRELASKSFQLIRHQ